MGNILIFANEASRDLNHKTTGRLEAKCDDSVSKVNILYREATDSSSSGAGWPDECPTDCASHHSTSLAFPPCNNALRAHSIWH